MLAAGYGTRLAPLTGWLPKPAIPVANRPMASFSMDVLASVGVDRLCLNTHHLPDALKSVLTPPEALASSLTFSDEEVLLGTAGGVRRAGELLGASSDDLVLVMNGDILFRPDLRRAMALHQELNAFATLVVQLAPHHPAGRALGVELLETGPGSGGRIRRVLGSDHDDTKHGLTPVMFTGVSVLNAGMVHRLPKNGCLIRDGVMRWTEEGLPVAALLEVAPFMDLGTLDSYYRANMSYAAGLWSWPHGMPPVHPTATVEAEVAGSVVGPHAVISASVRDSVVWGGTKVTSPVVGSIVTPYGEVPVSGEGA